MLGLSEQRPHHLTNKCKSNYQLKLEQILVLILDHIQSRVNRIGDGLFSGISAGQTVPVISVGGTSTFTLARCYQRGWLLYMLNLISIEMNQCRCRHSHNRRIGLTTNYHHQLQETRHISLSFVTIDEVLTRLDQVT